ncbi:MAG: SDR family NAD(P)-dependent oxidoreductase, partial [Deltaproteobacteria bacterium]
MTWDIRGKRVLVTGATSGIGLEAARSLAKQGAKVVMVGRDTAKTARCLDDVRASALGAEVSSLLCD